MTDKIAVIKTGWSADFTGSSVEAAHAYVKQFKDGHEKYNFLPGPDGRFYAYTPPVAGGPPKPKEANGWLIFSVAKAPKRAGLYLTGWFEDASFERTYVKRPEYKQKRPLLPLDDEGSEFSYTLSSDSAVRIDTVAHPFILPGDHMKRSPIYYLRGNGSKGAWCERVAKQLLAIRRTYRPELRQPQQSTDSSTGGGICADAERRKEVEVAAIARVKAEYPDNDFDVDDRQRANCGFDLLVRSRENSQEELHIEVKGTQNSSPHFFMSHKEFGYMATNPRHWRLAMVTDALDEPKLEILNKKQAEALFFGNLLPGMQRSSRALLERSLQSLKPDASASGGIDRALCQLRGAASRRFETEEVPPLHVQYNTRAAGSLSARARSNHPRISRIASVGYTYFTDPNFVSFRERAASSISSVEPGYHPVSTSFEPGVKRWVMSSAVRSRPCTPASAAAVSSSSRPYCSRQPSTGMIGAIVRPTG